MFLGALPPDCEVCVCVSEKRDTFGEVMCSTDFLAQKNNATGNSYIQIEFDLRVAPRHVSVQTVVNCLLISWLRPLGSQDELYELENFGGRRDRDARYL